jgi:transcriptional regulator with XRE-family HTH domain
VVVEHVFGRPLGVKRDLRRQRAFSPHAARHDLDGFPRSLDRIHYGLVNWGRHGSVLDFVGHPMPSFRPDSHKTMAEQLRHRRKVVLRLSLEEAVEQLPKWMGFDFSTLARIERGVRKVSYPELRELAIVLETTVGELDAQVDLVLRARKTAEQPQAKLPTRATKRKTKQSLLTDRCRCTFDMATDDPDEHKDGRDRG